MLEASATLESVKPYIPEMHIVEAVKRPERSGEHVRPDKPAINSSAAKGGGWVPRSQSIYGMGGWMNHPLTQNNRVPGLCTMVRQLHTGRFYARRCILEICVLVHLVSSSIIYHLFCLGEIANHVNSNRLLNKIVKRNKLVTKDL